MPLKIDNAKRMQQIVTKVKSSENVPGYLENKNEQQQQRTSFKNYFKEVNAYFNYYVPKHVIGLIALQMIDAIQRHLEQNNGQLAHVLTPDHLVAIRVGDQFSKSELLGNVRFEIDAEIQRVEDPRQRALPSADQTKIIWLKDFPYMSPQQIKDNIFTSGEKDVVWSLGIMLFELISGPNIGSIFEISATKPKQQWHWTPLNDEKGEMAKIIGKINDEQQKVEMLRNTMMRSLEEKRPVFSIKGSTEFDLILKECVQNDHKNRATLTELAQKIKQTLRFITAHYNVFTDRQDAGKKLAQILAYLDQMKDDIVVLALPNGGVPVAYEVAKSLNAPLGLLFAKKIGLPQHEEIAAAAVADGNPPKTIYRIDDPTYSFHKYIEIKKKEIVENVKQKKEKFSLNKRRPIPLEGRIVIVVDDGIATGLSAEAALVQLRDKKAAVVMLASPVCPLSTVEKFEKDGVKIVCLETPPLFSYVGCYYKQFDHVSDQEVISYLDRANEWMEQENAK
ncbi:hypothetical protein niasHT_029620 [Heterodera trifolii]|uniref:Protein kinase domain-containing protein n=1 Tax=Heterodera trifolii TaxID=157864 RepID=A0ABD2JKX5_9BILA